MARFERMKAGESVEALLGEAVAMEQTVSPKTNSTTLGEAEPVTVEASPAAAGEA
jgi:hypothetical protein